MKKLYILLACLVAVLPVMGATRSKAVMESIAREKLLGAGVKSVSGSPSLQLVCALEDPAFAVFKPSEGAGFVIVSRDDAFTPVLGYSTSAFDAENIPCCMKWWMQETSAGMRAQTGKRQVKKVKDFHPTPIEPLLTTKWSQNEPYNSMLPNDKQNTRPMTGCVATAMAQVLNYNQYPASAKFLGKYKFVNDANTYGSYIESTYQYPYLDGYGGYWVDYTNATSNSMSYSEEEGYALGTLLRDCGYAVEMTYSSAGSYASLTKAIPAFTEIFKYPKQSIKFRDRKYDSDDFWLGYIMTDLRRGSPVIYGGTDPNNNAGHAFILHGVDADGNFAVTWGWAGMCDGYFNIDYLVSNGVGDYTSQHQMVTGIHPQAYSDEVVTSRWYFYDESDPSNMGNYRLEWTNKYSNTCLLWSAQSNLWNASPTFFHGTLYFVVEDMTANTTKLVTKWLNLPPLNNFVDVDADFNISVPFKGVSEYPIPILANDFKRGHEYRVYFASKHDDEQKYSPFECAKGYIYFYLTMGNNGSVTITGPEYVPTAIKDVKMDAATTAKGQMTRVYDVQGRLLYSAPTASFRIEDVNARGMLMIQQGDKVRKVIR